MKYILPIIIAALLGASNSINIQGTGLGLNIVKQYVELMKGTVSYESEENKGSTFSVTIPLKTK